jgi:PAS domain-containing protein
MKTPSQSNRNVQLAFGSAILALVPVGAVSHRGMAVSDSSNRWVRHSHQVLETLQDLRVSQTEAFLLLGTCLGLMIAVGAYLSMRRKNSGRSLAEQAFRDSEEKYRMLLDGVQDHAIFMLDPHGQIMSWNAGAERIQGYASEEIIGRNFSCFFPAEDIQHGRPEAVLAIAAPAAGMKSKACGYEKMAPAFWPTLPAPRCANRVEVCADFPRSAAISARARSLEQNIADCWKQPRTPWSW